ncbi:TPA: hypothetical protein ACW7QF_001898 [Klebsiella aerogenes]|uniref:hypothetical protein n=1 Tax=Klebsiella TaxID=570 RepID=UPI002928C21A|nr:hypothetical protein [Klebsiella sp. 141203]MDU9363223.1 hypothetical protein [Klebsiella sp. 141203]HEP0588716.1 hypothetical protein [Klebsiella aerogenes]
MTNSVLMIHALIVGYGFKDAVKGKSLTSSKDTPKSKVIVCTVFSIALLWTLYGQATGQSVWGLLLPGLVINYGVYLMGAACLAWLIVQRKFLGYFSKFTEVMMVVYVFAELYCEVIKISNTPLDENVAFAILAVFVALIIGFIVDGIKAFRKI